MVTIKLPTPLCGVDKTGTHLLLQEYQRPDLRLLKASPTYHDSVTWTHPWREEWLLRIYCSRHLTAMKNLLLATGQR